MDVTSPFAILSPWGRWAALPVGSLTSNQPEIKVMKSARAEAFISLLALVGVLCSAHCSLLIVRCLPGLCLRGLCLPCPCPCPCPWRCHGCPLSFCRRRASRLVAAARWCPVASSSSERAPTAPASRRPVSPCAQCPPLPSNANRHGPRRRDAHAHNHQASQLAPRRRLSALHHTAS